MQQQLPTVPMCAECYSYAKCDMHQLSALLPMGMTSVNMDDPKTEENTENEKWGRIGVNTFAQEFFRRGAELKPERLGYALKQFQEKRLQKTFYDKNKYSEKFRLGVASAFGIFFEYIRQKYPNENIQQEDVLIWFVNSIHSKFSEESVYDAGTYANESYIDISTDVYTYALDQFKKAVADERKSTLFFTKWDKKKGRFVTPAEDTVVNQYKEARQNHDHNEQVVQPRGSPHEEKKRDVDPLSIQGHQKLLVERTGNDEIKQNGRRKRSARKRYND
eukprot:3666685-Rhodomonas_salina.1